MGVGGSTQRSEIVGGAIAALPRPRPGHLRIVAVSDTHNAHADLIIPSGDVFVHAGDATNFGTAAEMVAFYTWLEQLEHPVKIFVPGNHEFGLDARGREESHCFWTWCRQNRAVDVARALRASPPAVRLTARAATLINSSRRLASSLQLHGLSHTPPTFSCCRMAFHEEAVSRLPQEAYVLVSHAPPLGVLDASGCDGTSHGSPLVRLAARRLGAKLHLFGHVHLPHGGVRLNESVCSANVSMGVDCGVTVVDVPLSGGTVALPVWRVGRAGCMAYPPAHSPQIYTKLA